MKVSENVFHNPKLAKSFAKLQKIYSEIYLDYDRLLQDIDNLEKYLSDMRIVDWTCKDTGIGIEFYGQKRRLMFWHETMGQPKPLGDCPLRIRQAVVPLLPVFVENLTKYLWPLDEYQDKDEKE
jgi:hypothetical protein